MAKRLSMLLILFAAGAAPACFADEKHDTAPIVSALIEVTKDADENLRYAAYDALKTQSHSDELLESYWRGLEDDSSRIRLLSLNKIVEMEGPTEKVLERLILLGGETNIATTDTVKMQNLVIKHLISIGAPAIPYLLEAVKEGEAGYVAIHALGRIPLGEHYAAVTTQLVALLKSENKNVRIVAIQSLQSILSAAAQATARRDRDDQKFLTYYENLIRQFDSNEDGSLTEDEWGHLSKAASADANGDGRVTAEEFANRAIGSQKPGE